MKSVVYTLVVCFMVAAVIAAFGSSRVTKHSDGLSGLISFESSTTTNQADNMDNVMGSILFGLGLKAMVAYWLYAVFLLVVARISGYKILPW